MQSKDYQVHCVSCGWEGKLSQLALKQILLPDLDITKEPCCPSCQSQVLEVLMEQSNAKQ